jgi:hypothetical protein
MQHGQLIISEIHYIATALIFILIWLRYKSNNGLYGVFAGMLSLYLTIEFIGSNAIFLGVTLAFVSFYLMYDGLLK